MGDRHMNSAAHESASLCDSESSSVANMNYSGPDLDKDKPAASQQQDVRAIGNYVVKPRPVIVLFCDKRYIKSFAGVLRLLQVVLSAMSLLSLTTTRNRDNAGFLLLPLSWHFRVMLFVLLLTLLTSLVIWAINATGAIIILPVNWYFLDMVVYSVFSFLYLVGTSLVASAFDFYEKMDSDVPHSTIQQLVFCVVIGYMCMVMYGLTALIGYRRWRIQHCLFKRRKLLEEEQDGDLDI